MKFKNEDIQRWQDASSLPASSLPLSVSHEAALADLQIPLPELIEILENRNLSDSVYFKFRVKPDFLYNDWWRDEPVIWFGEADGSFVIYVDPAKMAEVTKLHLLFSMLSAYRWSMQRNNPNIVSVAFSQNYENFISWVCEKTGESRNTMDHFMYEVSPCHIDCVMFACECLDVSRPVLPSFAITPELLKKLDK